MPSDATYWGLKLYEWLTLIGVILGPLVAVAISLWVEGRRQSVDRRAVIARTLMGTRHLPADPQYNGAINLVPIEFNNVKPIMTAWHAYIAAVRYQPTEANVQTHIEELAAKQSTLIFQILSHLGYRLSENDIRTTAYTSQAFAARENLFLNAWASWIRIADALEGQAAEATAQQAPPHPAPTNIPDPSLSGPASPAP